MLRGLQSNRRPSSLSTQITPERKIIGADMRERSEDVTENNGLTITESAEQEQLFSDFFAIFTRRVL